MSRATIKDLANKLGVSPSTISRALTDHADISDEMKKKVAEVAKELHYTKNRRAASLRKKTSDVIALIVPEINMFFMPELIYGVNNEAERLGLSVMILQTDNSIEKEQKLLRYCLEMSFGGVLLCLSYETTGLDHIYEIIEDEIPVVLLDKVISSPRFSTISIRDEQAGYKAAEYLYNKGHRHILGLFANPELEMTKSRIRGFERLFAEKEHTAHTFHHLEIENILELDGFAGDVLDRYPEITSVFCMSDELLVNAHHLLMRKGYHIPDDLSLFAISDGFAPYFLHPNVTHLHHSGYEVGVESVKQLHHQILNSSDMKVEAINVGTKLFEMASVADITD